MSFSDKFTQFVYNFFPIQGVSPSAVGCANELTAAEQKVDEAAGIPPENHFKENYRVCASMEKTAHILDSIHSIAIRTGVFSHTQIDEVKKELGVEAQETPPENIEK